MYNSAQEIFNKVWEHFITNNNPPGYNQTENICCYNTETGGCAIGCLLSKEDAKKLDDYSNSGFPLTVSNAVNLYPETIYKYISADVSISFLTDLQMAHDTSVSNQKDTSFNFKFELKIRLTNLADKYHLSVPFAPLLS